jgi:UDPglucose--hexose-1-phosphate uridylyltransferase
MAKFVPDVNTQRWIIISPVRQARPDDMNVAAESKPKVCAFCPGSEQFTTEEVMRVGEGGPADPGWWIRVITNKYPITDYHEVIIHSPDHQADLYDFDVSHVEKLLGVYRSRTRANLEHGQVIIFCNHGEHAGASMKHPHSQLVVIPRQINLDALVREPVLNVIEDNTYFVSYCPDFSQWPYEVWIAPKAEGSKFVDIGDIEMADLAGVLQRALKRLKAKYDMNETKKIHDDQPFAYNYYIHHGENWFIRIIPRLIHRAGFELGTGLSVNVKDPTNAAEELREIKI